MKKLSFVALAVFAVICLLMAVPASAVIMEETYKGQVSKLEPSKNRLTMQVSSVYTGNEWLPYAKSSLKNNIVEGTVYNPDIFNDLKQGDPIEATILAGPGGEWITVGLIGSVGSTQSPLIASYGDPSRLISYFYKGYTVKTELKPDCAECTGTTCIAASAIVSPERDGKIVETNEMYPGYTHVFGWNSEYQYILKIKFNSGDASSDKCPGFDGMAGPQAISDFTIYDTQRSTILASEVDITPSPTPVSTAAPAETELYQVTPEMTTEAETQAPLPQATQSGLGFELFIAAGFVGCALLLLRRD